MAKDRSSGVLGFLIGGAIGLAVGLLIAPEQGEKLRRKVAYRIKATAEQLSDLVENFGQEDDFDTSEARREGQELIEDTTHQAQQLLEEMDAMMAEVKRKGA